MIPDTDKLRLDDKVILITGSGDGIGKAVALACAERGATIILLGRTVHKLEQVYDEIKNNGCPEPAIYPMNLEGATPTDYEELNTNIDREFGRLDGLHNNAGWLGASTPIEIYDTELWYKVMQVNLNAPFLLTKACIPLLRKSTSARIVFTADDKSSAYWG
ncbi:MAG: SDR family NAD(P)-dependent oxidoreductase, partial [Gammaproteobacteria bacterium]